ncbi:NOL1/NOP2/sun family putative RNA methylase [Nanoarchaeota archaeon]
MPTPIPKSEELKFKEKFIERYSQLTDMDLFRKYSLSFLRKSIRVNTLKIPINRLKARLESDWELKQVPWCKEGFWIEHKGEVKRRDIGNLVEHALGYIYVQEAASMIPPIVLNPQPGEKVLDMCAAPGSKTTQIAQYMENKGILVANDVLGTRLAALGINQQRCGISNIMTVQMRSWRRVQDQFDRILVDAPCSGTGTIRKSIKTIAMWNPNLGNRMATVQKQLITQGFDMLRPGGTLVYSTCTLEPHEDEAVVDFLLSKYDNAKVEPINLKINQSPAVTQFEGQTYTDEVKKCLRIWPQDNDTEGFFVAKITKQE